MSVQSTLDTYVPFVQLIGAQFGDSCNATLYGFDEPGGRVVVTTGNLTREEEGDPAPKFIQRMMKESNGNPQNKFGFINKELNGHVLRTSLLFIRGINEDIVGCLCIHHNIVQIQMVISFLEEFYRSNNLEDENEFGDAQEKQDNSPNSIEDFVRTTIANFMNERVGLRSFASLDKQEKIMLIKELDEKGIFLVKGAVNLVAKQVQLTKFTIYNYLDEIRTADARNAHSEEKE
ncbi:transcriptional regulator [Bacillus salipaludis]|uniref:Transcriptional regulator n=1 Tax=Bacillus salipaludis TaxID=2547811 RepID=A0ABW8RG75_9BACI